VFLFLKKIESKEEKDRLKRLVRSINLKGFGRYYPNIAEGKKLQELDKRLAEFTEPNGQ